MNPGLRPPMAVAPMNATRLTGSEAATVPSEAKLSGNITIGLSNQPAFINECTQNVT
jgi:hypothetical protein